MSKRRILVTPLDWGLGHATRCIPIIRLLLEYECDVFLGGSGHSLELLQKEFPSLNHIKLPAYDPVYPSYGSMAWAMFTQAFKFMNAIRREHQIIENYVLTNYIDYIISDNRYGCWSVHARSVFITHQTNIIMSQGFKWLGGFVNYFNHRQIQKFNQCWIPDLSDHTFSGVLSKGLKQNRFIGPLSRFSKSTLVIKKYNLLILLSGPEPQRSILEELLIGQTSETDLNILLVRGTKGNLNKDVFSQIKIVNFLPTEELQKVIEQSELIISRPGYSTIMDLAKLGKKAIFIPTPGQTEQEYLAMQMKEKGIAYFETQKDFNLHKALAESDQYSGFEEFGFTEQHLPFAIRELLNLNLKRNETFF